MIVLVMGVSGSGKTTIGQALAAALAWPFFDADDFHDPASIEKMRRGEPLTNDDRVGWLSRLRQLMAERHARHEDAVLACSALSSVHRERLGLPHPGVRMVLLHGPEAVLRQRLQQRHDHFVRDQLLTSQLALLEPPPSAIRIDIRADPATIVAQIRAAVGM